ncbi:hypothetical protein [Streptomyces xiaopingdaonensis]|uniref:hypothetical protein n=1 Tax=Streptomyces xiaopingdaonensis TaxID=1565415 RepID=UPI00036F9F7A|nr:hypothetical protein [Streptomyces xiaopingdaonensis]
MADRLRMALWMAGAVTAFGVVGLVLSALKAPPTLTWAAAAGAAGAGGWGATRLTERYIQRP